MGSTDRWGQKVGLVTGGASGIGEAIVRRLTNQGASVVIADIDTDGIARLEADLGAVVSGVRTDVTRESDVAHAFSEAMRVFGHLDFVFAVAGAARGSVLTETTEEDWDFTSDLCLKGVFLTIKYAGKTLSRTPAGSIVVVSSLNSEVPAVGLGTYCAAKAGAAMLAKVAALELAAEGIRVNSLAPGLTRTPLAAGLIGNPGVLAAFTDRIPIGRPAEPLDFAGAACFLASEDAAYITGVNLFVDGGWRESVYPDVKKLRSGQHST